MAEKMLILNMGSIEKSTNGYKPLKMLEMEKISTLPFVHL